MNEELKRVSEVVKKIVAAGLFLILLTGGASAVLSVLAAGLNTLSSKPSLTVQQVRSGNQGTVQNYGGVSSSSSNNVQQNPGNTSSSLQRGTSNPAGANQQLPNQTGAAQPQALSTRSNQGVAVTMTSPVGQALDKGGVVVGQRVQQAFGNVLSNVIRILFVERPETYSTPSTSSSSSSSAPSSTSSSIAGQSGAVQGSQSTAKP